jgi:hypothetical protein
MHKALAVLQLRGTRRGNHFMNMRIASEHRERNLGMAVRMSIYMLQALQ